MNKNRKIVAMSVLLVAVLFAGTVLYYNNAVSFRDSIIGGLSSQVNSLNNQIADLNSQISSLKNRMAANLVTALGASEVQSNSTYNADNPTTFNHLFISGTVRNEGLETAYNAGLHVVAYDATSEVVINMTVPLGYGTYGSGSSNSPLTLGRLNSQESVTVSISIVHINVAATWKITPVWTNSP
jgi:outer membrane murein-binding lipoprotein Lpp